MLRSSDIHLIYNHLFTASTGDASFAESLEAIVRAFGGEGGVLFELDRKTGVISKWVGPGLESGEEEYIDHLNAINPRMHYSMRHSPGHVLCDGMIIDDRSMDKHEFYDAIFRATGVRYFLGSRIFDEGNISLFHSIEFTKNQGHPEKEKLEAFKRLIPAIGNAWKLNQRSIKQNSLNVKSPWTSEHLHWAIFGLSSHGTIVEMNSSAQNMLDRADVVVLHDGKLEPIDYKSLADFKAALHLGISGKQSATLLSTGIGNAPVVAQIIPVTQIHMHDQETISLVIYICNPIKIARNIGDTLRRLYGFTEAETRLAITLTTGVSLLLAAEQLGISRNTARNQLQKMFVKTGSNRQNEFLVRILGILEG